ncbi:hypothetical protein BDN72DRAFT_111375 [Pluteus cervinus]|uniref:Uncharacterized protein n=1 Tax=Pluteus cervinus TaxID=181527 RepID=A0ACD3AN99_9AGAR|nr:hypothetical protein BDN72DRAFT_111375 [Pluteus cervinus]
MTHSSYLIVTIPYIVECGGMELAWKKILFNKKRTEEQVCWDIKLGKGKLWCFSRPDRFPIEVASKAPLNSTCIREHLHAIGCIANYKYQTICQCISFPTLVNSYFQHAKFFTWHPFLATTS